LHAYSSYEGLGQVDQASFLGGSLFSTFVLGIGIIFLVKYLTGEKQSRRHSQRHQRKSRADYVKYVARQHKLSKRDQQYLMEHEE
jgi:hypothetical protein